MREVRSTRRRRLRLIQAEDSRTAHRFHRAASALTSAADSEAARIESDALQQHLSLECHVRSRTRLRVEHPGAEPLIVMLTSPYLLIGSDRACDLTLQHEEIAPHQAYLQWIDGHVFYCDVAPRSGTIPARHQQPNGRWLTHDPIAIGPYQLRLENETSLPEPDYSPLDRSQRLVDDFPQFALQFKGVEQSDNQWPVNRVLTMIGRGVQCKLRLNHPSMPNVQAGLLRTKKGCFLIDVAGVGTTGVNGRIVRLSAIDIGDTLQLGPFQVEVVTTVFDQVDFSPSSHRKKALSKISTSDEFDQYPLATGATVRAEISNDALHEHQDSVATTSSVTDIMKSRPIAPITHLPYASSGLTSLDSMVGPAVTNPPEEEFAQLTKEASESAEIREASQSVINVKPELIANFVQSQQSQLAQLKTGLDRLKGSLSESSGRASSKKLKNLLIKSVTDTLKTQVAMSESLMKLIESIEVER